MAKFLKLSYFEKYFFKECLEKGMGEKRFGEKDTFDQKLLLAKKKFSQTYDKSSD